MLPGRLVTIGGGGGGVGWCVVVMKIISYNL